MLTKQPVCSQTYWTSALIIEEKEHTDQKYRKSMLKIKMSMAESLCCLLEAITTLLIGYTPIQK